MTDHEHVRPGHGIGRDPLRDEAEEMVQLISSAIRSHGRHAVNALGPYGNGHPNIVSTAVAMARALRICLECAWAGHDGEGFDSDIGETCDECGRGRPDWREVEF